MNWIQALYTGNPAAFAFITCCIAFSVLVIWLTPLCDKEFDDFMQKHEEERALAVYFEELEEEFRRAA